MARTTRWLVSLGLLSGGCSTPSATTPPDLTQVQSLVALRSAQVVRWNSMTADDASVARELHQLLGNPLTAEQAAAIALLNNRSVQATYEDVGVAQADLVQAGLLSNPKLFASIRFPNHGPASPDAEFSIAQDFLELFLVPLRRRIAGEKLAAAQARVADAVLMMEHDARVAFYTYQASRQTLMLQQTIVDAERAALELSRQQHTAGNISDLDAASEEANASATRLELARTQAQVREDRERVNQLLGLYGPDAAGWESAEKLPDLPAAEAAAPDYEATAIRQRLDLNAERLETELTAQSLGLAERFRLTGIELGFDVNRRDPTERYVTVAGPTLAVELPIFDQKQGAIARLAAEYRQGVDRLSAKAIDIRSQVRGARDRLNSAREIAALYRDAVIPQRQEATRLSHLHYNVMLLGVDRWLMARQAETTAYQEYIRSVRDYWIARADLERAVGGKL